MALGYNGFEVERAASGRAALAAVEQRRPDLIVLDVMLPDLDGFEVARRLRQSEGAGTRVPVIFLTARDTTADKVEGLRLGTDDYVTKPFSIEELIERVKAVLRRSSGTGPGEHKLSYADLELDEDTRDVWRGGKLVTLTVTEYKLLHYLLSNSRRVLTREQILDKVWDYSFASNASVLEKFRPTGMLFIISELNVAPVVVVEMSTTGACPITSIFSVTPAVMTTSTRRRAPRRTSTSLRSTVLKPCSNAFTE